MFLFEGVHIRSAADKHILSDVTHISVYIASSVSFHTYPSDQKVHTIFSETKKRLFIYHPLSGKRATQL